MYKQLGITCKIAENVSKLDIDKVTNSYAFDMRNHIIQSLLGREQVIITYSQLPLDIVCDINTLNEKRTWYLFDYYDNFIIYLDEIKDEKSEILKETLIEKKYDVHLVDTQEEGIEVAIDYANTTIGIKADVVMPKISFK